jgi:hypothetical protein
MQNRAFPSDLRVLNIDGFAQKITMKVNRLPRQHGRNQHLGGNIGELFLDVLHQINIDAFMAMGSFLLSSPPQPVIVEQHARQEEKMGDWAQLIDFHKTTEK